MENKAGFKGGRMGPLLMSLKRVVKAVRGMESHRYSGRRDGGKMGSKGSWDRESNRPRTLRWEGEGYVPNKIRRS